MIDHTGIGVADVGRSATFYDAALGALGMRRVMQMPDNVRLRFRLSCFLDRSIPPTLGQTAYRLCSQN
jgi:catechol 2,3-dioxygenase-like lactoylglutathione lyase family enzyme